MRVYLIGLAAALAAMAGWSALMKNQGVQSERARVERVAEKTHERAKVARKKVEAKKPAQIRDELRKYCVDCDAQ